VTRGRAASFPGEGVGRARDRDCRASRGETGLHLERRSAAREGGRYDGSRHSEEGNGVIASEPTLRQAWQRCEPMPQYAFKMSMFNVSCNSH
jgi:hypothetical protein